jgi:hypothetical protein
MITVEEAINNFYKEKSKYESLLDKNKRAIIKDKELSWKEKRIEYKKIKPKCINCNRPVGSKFTITHETNVVDDKYRVLRAICGDRVNPCNLNININAGSYKNINSNLKNHENELKEYKMKIIADKNKLLFGYISTEEAIKNFEEGKENLAFINEILSYFYKNYNDIFDNNEKKDVLKQLITSSYLNINEIKDSIKKFQKTNNTQYCKDAVTIYTNQLKPQLQKIMNLKYSSSFVDYDNKTGIYSLIQQKHTIQDLENEDVKPKINNYEKGIANVIKNNTKKVRDVPTIKKNITRKKTLLTIEEEPESEDPESEESDSEEREFKEREFKERELENPELEEQEMKQFKFKNNRYNSDEESEIEDDSL